jgi:hypothetical protein
MNAQSAQRRSVHLVGSVPLATASDVFSTLGRTLGPYLHRIPDGETGARLSWGRWQTAAFEKIPQLDAIKIGVDWRDDVPTDKLKFRLKPGAKPDAIVFGELGYAKNAIESHAAFAALKREGRIPAATRFQVSMPTPYGITNILMERDSHEGVEPAYEQALKREIEAIVSHVPAGELAFQWDAAQEMECIASGHEAFFPVGIDDVAKRIARLIGYVDKASEVGVHFCYGDYAHKHFIEPKDTGDMVDVLNGIWQLAPRPVDFVHMPVPKDRSDAAYFAPLERLARRPETELFLGLVHFTGGIEGTLDRIAAAKRFVTEFGISTECGWGRRDPNTLSELIQIHVKAAEAR